MSKIRTITLAPDALDRNGISLSQTLASGNLDHIINGTLSSGLDRNGICASQTPSGTTALTLNGVLGVSFKLSPVRVTIYGASDESGKTLTVTGKNGDGAVISEAITGPNNYTVSGSTLFSYITSIVPSGTFTGAVEVGVFGVMTPAIPMHISIYGGSNESSKTFTITGTDFYDNVLTSTITGPNNSTVVTTENFKTVTRVVGSAAMAGATEVGVDGTCESPWQIVNYRGRTFNLGFGVDLSSGASLTYDVEHTFYDLLGQRLFTSGDAPVFNHDSVVNETTAQYGNYTNPPTAIRLAITAHTSGSANLRITQSGGA